MHTRVGVDFGPIVQLVFQIFYSFEVNLMCRVILDDFWFPLCQRLDIWSDFWRAGLIRPRQSPILKLIPLQPQISGLWGLLLVELDE
jgi:hypothetical protein